MSELHFNVERRAGIPWAISATVEVVATIREPLKVIRRKAVLLGVKAKLDTGCSHTVVPHQIIRELESRLGAKLEPIERRAVFVANRKEVECPAFDLMLRVLDSKNVRWPAAGPLRPPSGVTALDGADAVLVGLDLLQHATRAEHVQTLPQGRDWLILTMND